MVLRSTKMTSNGHASGSLPRIDSIPRIPLLRSVPNAVSAPAANFGLGDVRGKEGCPAQSSGRPAGAGLPCTTQLHLQSDVARLWAHSLLARPAAAAGHSERKAEAPPPLQPAPYLHCSGAVQESFDSPIDRRSDFYRQKVLHRVLERTGKLQAQPMLTLPNLCE